MGKGMILAAGRGTRVRPLTRDLPKPMVPILGKPVMEYLVEHLARHGITEIMVNVAWHHQKLRSTLAMVTAGACRSVTPTKACVTTARSCPARWAQPVVCGASRISVAFLTKPPWCCAATRWLTWTLAPRWPNTRTKERLPAWSPWTCRLPMCPTMASWWPGPTAGSSPFRKPQPVQAKSTLASTGIYIFEPAALALIPPGQVYDIGSQLFPQLVAQGLPFYVQNRPFNWIDIGRVSDYWSVLQRVLRGEVAEMNMPGRQVRPGIWVGLNTSVAWDQVTIEGPVYIGSSVRIEPGASIIGPSWIGHGSHIRTGARVVRSILFEYTRIAADMRFTDMIVSPDYCVDRHGDTLYRGDDTSQLRWGDARA